MRKLWSDLAWEQLQDWSARDRKTLKRIYALIQSIDRNGYSCIGKPEPLKGNLSGWWSVRIDEANRLVFRIDDGILVICSCTGHYTAVDPSQEQKATVREFAPRILAASQVGL